MKFRHLAFVIMVSLPAGSVVGQYGSASGAIDIASPTFSVKDIKPWVEKLAKHADPEGQKEAREVLWRATLSQNLAAGQLDAYARILNTELLPLTKDPNRTVRLNAGIVAAKVGDKAQSASLAGMTEALLNDVDEAVTLWGLRAAQSVMPAVMRNPLLAPNTKLPDLVEAALKKYPSGFVAREAYQAMTMGLFDPNVPQKPNAQLLTAVLPRMLRMLDARLALYKKQVPDDLTGEPIPVLFLSSASVWNVAAIAQKQQIVQLLSDLISLSAQHAIAGAPQHRDLLLVLSRTGAAFVVISGYPGVNNPALEKAAESLQRARQQIVPADLPQRVAAFFAALNGSPTFKLNPPPTVAANATTGTAPTGDQ